MMRLKIPEPTIKRLLVYYRFLENQIGVNEQKVLSSRELGEGVGVTSNLVRRDLSFFGEFGCQGVGYDVEILKDNLKKIIGISQQRQVILVGAGNLGRALLNYNKFVGIEIVEVFDCDLNKIGNTVNKLEVKNVKLMEEIIKERDIKLAIIAVPADYAQNVALQITGAGIKAIWNFAPVPLKMNEDVVIINEDLACGLGCLVYKLNQLEQQIV